MNEYIPIIIILILLSCCGITAISGKKLKKSANTDALTGMFNRKVLPQIEASEKGLKKYFVIACDIDHFKRVNDTFGHAAGDIVIKSVSEAIKASFKSNIDFVVRFGGEEFFIFMLDNGADKTLIIDRVDSIRKKIENMTILTKDMNVIKITSSFGICFNTDLSLKERIDASDKFLYEAKESGRNKVISDYNK